MKRCCTCKENKPLEAYSRASNKPDGRQSRCKACAVERGRIQQREWRQANREHVNAWYADWRAHNPQKAKAISANRYARRLGAKGRGVTADDWARILEDYGHRCAYCARTGPLTRDHVDPLSRGGLHEPENVVPACMDCNTSKFNSTLLEWLARKRAA